MSAPESGRARAHLDLRGLNCPLPVLKARKRIRSLAAGDELTLETTDPLAAIDIPAFCAEQGLELLENVPTAGGHRFRLRLPALWVSESR